jgi:SAM-dependent methyltransferase
VAARYDAIGRTYTATRTTDPRIAARIWAALGDARTVVNVGAGTGNYEPPDRAVTAVEPSAVMIAQRPAGAAPAVQASAEALPFADASFDVATSVYLFHELPRNTRRNVVREMFRVVRPGGLLVIEDSAQLSESADIATALRSFPGEFHEPFYADYLEDDLAELLREVGFAIESVEPQFVAKVVVARRP